MALKIAGMLQKNGGEVVLFVDLEGARLADKRVPADMKWGQAETTVAALFEAFVKEGGMVKVCPHCAKAAGLDSSNLRDGATILTADELADLIAGADKIMDY